MKNDSTLGSISIEFSDIQIRALPGATFQGYAQFEYDADCDMVFAAGITLSDKDRGFRRMRILRRADQDPFLAELFREIETAVEKDYADDLSDIVPQGDSNAEHRTY